MPLKSGVLSNQALVKVRNHITAVIQLYRPYNTSSHVACVLLVNLVMLIEVLNVELPRSIGAPLVIGAFFSIEFLYITGIDSTG